jgi:hypothetical protein
MIFMRRRCATGGFMSRVRFTPNQFATRVFNLHASEYEGKGIIDVMEIALTTPMAERYLFAQDPFGGGRTEGDIKMMVNPDEPDRSKIETRVIGRLQKLE